MAIKVYSCLFICFVVQEVFADPFHFHFGIQEPVVPFVGRHDFLQNLHEALTRKVIEKNVQYSSITFVTGRGGIGKTETARKYIETYAEAFDNVIWVEAENELEVEKSFRTLAKSKMIIDEAQIKSVAEWESESGNQTQESDDNIANSEHHSEMTDEIIQKIFQTLGREKRRTLIIFDNVDKIPWRFFPTDLNKDLNEISSSSSTSGVQNDLIPPSILILRKNAQNSSSKGRQQMDSVKWLPLAPFTDDDNINYILHYPNLLFDLTSDDLPEVKVIENARLLGQLLGGIPLALKQAMAFINVSFKKHPEKGLEKYLSLYKEVENRDGAVSSFFPLSSTLEPESEPESKSATLNPIFLTWQITREKLSQGFRGDFTTLIMDSLPYFPSSKMSIRLLYYILSGGKEPFRHQSYHNEKSIILKHAINTLHRHAILNIDHDQSDPKVDLDLDLDLVDGTLSMHRELQKAVRMGFKEEEIPVNEMGETFTISKYNQMALFLLLRSEEFLDKIIQEDEPLSLKELYSITKIFDSFNHLLTADAELELEAPSFEMLIRFASHKLKLALWFNKVESFEGEGNCKKLLYTFFELFKQIESEFSTKKSEINPELEIHVMELVRNTFMPPSGGHEKRMSPDLFQRALKFLNLLLEVSSQVLGESHPFRLFFLEEKADIKWRANVTLSFRQEALAHYHLLYDIRKTIFGEENQETMETLEKLAQKYTDLGVPSKSLEIYSQLLKVQERIFGSGSIFTTVTMQNMAAMLADMGQYEKALDLSKSVLLIRQKQNKIKEAANDQNYQNDKEDSAYEDVKVYGRDEIDSALLHNIAIYQSKLNNHQEAYTIWQQLYNEDLKNRGPDDLRTVRHESQMAKVLYTNKEYEKAMQMQLHVLKIREKILGPNDGSTMNTKFDLANLHYAQGNAEKSLGLYTLVYDVRKKTLGEDDEDTLSTLDKLADVHQLLKNRETAHELKSRVYTITRRLHGDDALETINARSGVAMAKAALEEHEQNPEAVPNLLKVLKKVHRGKSKLLGPFHDDTLVTLISLTTFQALAGEFDKSIKQLQATYDAISNSDNPAHGPDSTPALLILRTMSKVRKMQGKHGLALKLGRQVLDTYKRTLGPKHPSTVEQLEEVGSIHLSQQNYHEALKYYEELHSIMSKIYGPEDPKTLDAYETVGSIYMKQKEFKKAGVIYTELFEVRFDALGPHHPSTLSAMFYLGILGQEVGMHKEAIVMLRGVVDARVTAYGNQDERTISAMTRLAHSFFSLQNFEEALKTYKQVYVGQKLTLGEGHINTIVTLENMSICYRELGDLARALELARQVYKLKLKTLSQNHPQTKKSLEMKNSLELKIKQKKTEL